MPMQWVKPAVFLKHKRKTVYYSYKNGKAAFVMPYHFNTDLNETDEFQFDIRDLSTYGSKRDREKVIKEAINKGEIKFPD